MITSRFARVAAVASSIVGCVLFSGCGLGKAEKDAENVVARHFQAIATNGYAEAVAEHAPQAFQKMTREQWIEKEPEFYDKLGTYVRHKTRFDRLQKTGGSSGSTTVVLLTCQVEYSKHSATEYFTLLKGPTDRDFKIVGHTFSSVAFLKKWPHRAP
jgi:hypothetical protein